MDNQNKPKWYFKTFSLVVSFLCVGPFMLPLVWTNPRFNKKTRIIITVIVAVITYILADFFVKSLKEISGYYQLINE